jgi:hypothetical protein
MTAPAVSGPETSALLDGHNRTSKSRPPFRYCCAIHRVGGWVGLLLLVREGTVARRWQRNAQLGETTESSKRSNVSVQLILPSLCPQPAAIFDESQRLPRLIIIQWQPARKIGNPTLYSSRAALENCSVIRATCADYCILTQRQGIWQQAIRHLLTLLRKIAKKKH